MIIGLCLEIGLMIMNGTYEFGLMGLNGLKMEKRFKNRKRSCGPCGCPFNGVAWSWTWFPGLNGGLFVALT